MIPTSSTRIRPSTSMQAQFRPISPSPPRKTTRTAVGRGRPTPARPPAWPAPCRPWRARALAGRGLPTWALLGRLAGLPDRLSGPDPWPGLRTRSWPRRPAPPRTVSLRRRAARAPPGPLGVRQPTGAPDRAGSPGDDGAGLVVEARGPGGSGAGTGRRPARAPGRRPWPVPGLGNSSVDSKRYDSAGCWLTAGRRRHVAGPEGRITAANERAGPVGGHADDAGAADGQERQGQRVVAAVDVEPAGPRPPPAAPATSPVASLTPTMLGTSRGQRRREVGADPAARPDRDVVEDHRQVGGGGDGPEVGGEAGRRRPVVVRRDHQHAVRPRPPRPPWSASPSGRCRWYPVGGDHRHGRRPRRPPGRGRSAPRR